MEKGQMVEIYIDDMLDDGRAFGRYGGCAVFVKARGALNAVPHERMRRISSQNSLPARRPTSNFAARGALNAVPGDIARVRITKTKKSSAEAELVEVTEPSPDRIPAACPYFGECGGCTLQELSYDAQMRLKTEQLRAKLMRLGGLEDPKVNDILGAGTLQSYRNKAVFAVGPHGEVGFRKGKSHFVIDIESCLLQSDAAMVCADALRVFLKKTGVKCLKQMTVRTAFGTGEVMAVLESEQKEIPQIDTLVEMLDDAVWSLNGPDDQERRISSQNSFSLESVAVIHQGKCHIIAGAPTITDEFFTGSNAIRYEISPQSFFQVNPEQMSKLYDKAAEYALNGANDHSTLTILDLYCGAGTIGIWLLDKLRSDSPDLFERTKVIGIESVKPAIIDANRNSVINGFINTRYFCGKAEEELPGMMGLADLWRWNEVNERVRREPEIRIDTAAKDTAYDGHDMAETALGAAAVIDRVDVAVLDPPRAGCAEPLLDAVVTASPDRIVYVSCDPGTLARDIKYLSARGYEFIEATPVDQFPWTSHVETVCLLSNRKRKPDSYVKVSLDMEDYYRIKDGKEPKSEE